MQDKMRIKQRHLQEFFKWHHRHLCVNNMNCDIRRRLRVHSLWKGEKSKREQDENDE